MDLSEFFKAVCLRVEIVFPQVDTICDRLEHKIDAAVERLEGTLMLTRDELIEQVRTGFTDTKAFVSSEMAEVAAHVIEMRDLMGELQRKLDEALAGQDLTSLASEIMGGFTELQTRVSSISDAFQAPPPPPPIEPPVEPPIPVPEPPFEPVPETARR